MAQSEAQRNTKSQNQWVTMGLHDKALDTRSALIERRRPRILHKRYNMPPNPGLTNVNILYSRLSQKYLPPPNKAL